MLVLAQAFAQLAKAIQWCPLKSVSLAQIGRGGSPISREMGAAKAQHGRQVGTRSYKVKMRRHLDLPKATPRGLHAAIRQRFEKMLKDAQEQLKKAPETIVEKAAE